MGEGTEICAGLLGLTFAVIGIEFFLATWGGKSRTEFIPFTAERNSSHGVERNSLRSGLFGTHERVMACTQKVELIGLSGSLFIGH